MFFKKIDDFNPAAVTDALRVKYPDVTVTGVRILSQHQGSATHVLIGLEYGQGSPAGLPETMFVKTSIDATREELPSGLADNLAGEYALALYVTETRIYQLPEARIQAEMPKVFASGLGSQPGDFYLFLENLNDRNALCPRVIPALGVDRVANTLKTLASLHASFWGNPLKTELPWLHGSTDGQMNTYLRGDGWAPVDAEFSHPHKEEILREIGIDREHMRGAFWKRQESLNAMPETLLHGDPHPGNLFFLPDGTAGLLDWQLARRGPWTHDVSYAIISALDPEDRCAHERDLLATYRDDMHRLGVSDLPSPDEMWLAHRQSPAWGVPMWGITPDVMYAKDEVVTVVRRFAAAWRDFDTSAALQM